MAQNIYLCSGDRFSMMCSTNYAVLQWIVDSVPDSPYSSYHNYIYHHISWDHYRIIRNTQFEYFRNSEHGALPITSTLVINSVTNDISGIRIRCRANNNIISIAIINGNDSILLRGSIFEDERSFNLSWVCTILLLLHVQMYLFRGCNFRGLVISHANRRFPL